MTLKDIDDNETFTCWTIVDKEKNIICQYENKNNAYSTRSNRIETDNEIYHKLEGYKVLKIYDIDIDMNFENNYITVMIDYINKGDSNE